MSARVAMGREGQAQARICRAGEQGRLRLQACMIQGRIIAPHLPRVITVPDAVLSLSMSFICH